MVLNSMKLFFRFKILALLLCFIFSLEVISFFANQSITIINHAQAEEKEKKLFKNKIKAVEAGAHGTLEYTIKEGANKNKIADQKILKKTD